MLERLDVDRLFQHANHPARVHRGQASRRYVVLGPEFASIWLNPEAYYPCLLYLHLLVPTLRDLLSRISRARQQAVSQHIALMLRLMQSRPAIMIHMLRDPMMLLPSYLLLCEMRRQILMEGLPRVSRFRGRDLPASMVFKDKQHTRTAPSRCVNTFCVLLGGRQGLSVTSIVLRMLTTGTLCRPLGESIGCWEDSEQGTVALVARTSFCLSLCTQTIDQPI
jgi:hypothetical protein